MSAGKSETIIPTWWVSGLSVSDTKTDPCKCASYGWNTELDSLSDQDKFGAGKGWLEEGQGLKRRISSWALSVLDPVDVPHWAQRYS